MILVDTNIPMYLIGNSLSHKLGAQRVVQAAVATGETLVTDVEVLQEICHRFVAIDRRDAIQPAFDVLLEIVDRVLAIEADDVLLAKDVLFGNDRLSARDAVHVAVMRRHDVRRIMTFDRGFDAVPGIERVA